ncbi:MAG: phosphopantetheine-binding protein [Nautiliaceae bacterium]|jgi:acyl carrier protein
MTKQEFIEKLSEVLDVEVNENTDLTELEEWDSLAMLGVLSLYDELGVEIDINEMDEFKSVKDLLKKAHID